MLFMLYGIIQNIVEMYNKFSPPHPLSTATSSCEIRCWLLAVGGGVVEAGCVVGARVGSELMGYGVIELRSPTRKYNSIFLDECFYVSTINRRF